jgi:hypothetical protein
VAKNTRAAHPIGSINVRATPEKKKVFLIKRAHDYKIVMNGKTIFGDSGGPIKERKIYVNTTKAVRMTTIGADRSVGVSGPSKRNTCRRRSIRTEDL